MSIPREGTYKLTVTRLVNYSIILDDQRRYVAGDGRGVTENVFSPDIDVTFNGDEISFADATGAQRAFSPAIICSFETEPGVIFVYDGNFPNAWYCISLTSFALNTLGKAFLFQLYDEETRALSGTSLPIGAWTIAGTFIPYIVEDDTSFINFGTPECFLAGTMIEIEDGLKPVEQIEPGDRVKIRCGRYRQSSTVVWVGAQDVRVHARLPLDLAGYPIIIRAGAIASGVPKRDLCLTAEHCIALEGHLIPLRTLVNGRSILYDTRRERFTVYHFETIDHAVIFAEGLEVETFLDIGQRARFQRTKAISRAFLSRTPSRSRAAFPIGMPPRDMKRLWTKVARRVSDPNCRKQPPRSTRRDTPIAQLKVRGEHGETLPMKRIQRDIYRVLVPRQAKRLVFASPSFRFFDTHGPYYDDRRRLGLLVEQISLSSRNTQSAPHREVAFRLGDGWYGGGQNWPCWTDGAGEIILTPQEADRDRADYELEIHLNSKVYGPVS